MNDDFADELPPPSKTNWMLTLALVAVAGLAMAWFLHGLANPTPKGELHPSVGKAAPPLVAEGWLNGDPLTSDDLSGHVYVVDAWSPTCAPCITAAPHTIELYKRYKDKGVVFLGLAAEGSDKLDQSRDFLKKAKFPWPCAYGAGDTLAGFYQANFGFTPWLWVVNRKGVIVWSNHPLELTPELLDKYMNQ